ncbi:putative lipoprotein [Myxococcus xanthus DK 1622]|uniref:Lipoprotein n=1 Tax=Myxococcus xanthus (strain DK1622) TaxID=246197 RepID=Q1D180_MYXXD|nr:MULTISPECIES: hypothetical protein [Myxococcus]ABF87623.1 putative lipoprotein [Myxococcus xanthus DK 1622]NOJ55513.1 hypothetical protein [Myxococcus xanthus]QPM77898.1 hypothetical protein I5Q59_26925 [Myxococcus xanthus]QVW66965.1 hypothetical protein JTM82_32275 [Myxococcus xanthus DZ2]QZZ53098.1 hypothetical protein MyxoNM_28185 [Myxococcus xanthus]
MSFPVVKAANVKGMGWSAVLLAGLVGCGQEARKPAPEQEAIEAVKAQAQQLQPPAGCTEITMGELANGIGLTPTMYSPQPTYRGNFNNFGDPAFPDPARIRLDVNTAPGVYDLSVGGGNTFTCDRCVFGYQDEGSPAEKFFVADAGTLLLAVKVSPQQTLGALTNVTLRESVDAPPLNAPYWGSAVVPGGECRWIRFATWNTVRQDGCDPRQGSLTANLPDTTCVPNDYVASDGTLERALGTQVQGEACTKTAAASESELASTDCEQGFACTDLLSENAQCLKTCDFMAPNPGCPSGTMCGVYGLCTEQSVLEQNGFTFDPALTGEICSLEFAHYCGTEGARGVCADLNRDGKGECYPYHRARSECGPGDELGYMNYALSGGGFDRGHGFCYHDGL